MLEHLDGRLVTLKIRLGEKSPLHRANDRQKQLAQLTEPFIHGRSGEVNAVSLEDLLLTVKRLMIEVLGNDNVGKKARRRAALRKRPRRKWLHEVAVHAFPTAPLPLNILFDEKFRRDNVEFFCNDLVDPFHVAQTACANALCVIGIDGHRDTGKMLGDRLRSRLSRTAVFEVADRRPESCTKRHQM